MCNFENILQFLHFSIALDMSRITHFLAEIMNPKNSSGGNFLTWNQLPQGSLDIMATSVACGFPSLNVHLPRKSVGFIHKDVKFGNFIIKQC